MFLYLSTLVDLHHLFSISMGLMPLLFAVNFGAMMFMELETIFPPNEIMHALSIGYSQLFLEDKLTWYINTLKQIYGHLKDNFVAPHVCDTCLAMLSGMALDQFFHSFVVAMVDNPPHAMKVVDLHVHLPTILLCFLVPFAS